MTIAGEKYSLRHHRRLEALFNDLCSEGRGENEGELRQLLERSVPKFAAHRSSYTGPNLLTVTLLVETCRMLLDRYERESLRHQALIRGAVRYFVSRADAIDDLTPILGLTDDTLVLNHVLEQLRIFDRFIE